MGAGYKHVDTGARGEEGPEVLVLASSGPKGYELPDKHPEN